MFYGVAGGRSLRTGLLLGAASVAMASMSVSALAQEQGSTETVVVTGSRIPQTGLYSTSPVTAVGQQELKLQGTTDVTTLLNSLPSVFADQNSGVANGASGTANVDLRGLGSERTLVLVNGSRLMPGSPDDPVADLNDIPAALVDHVDVLTGGASAVYGSDALAGVVNFIMRKDFQGIELDGTYTITQNDNNTGEWRDLTQQRINSHSYGFAQSPKNIWNGQTTDGTFIMGVNSDNGKGNFTGYLGYRNSAAVWEASRDYSECTMNSNKKGGFSCAGSSNYNRWLSYDNLYCDIAGYYTGGVECPPGASFGLGFDYFQTGTGHAGSGTFGVPIGQSYNTYLGLGSQQFNYGALNYLQRPDSRYTGGFFAHYQENKELDIYSSFMFADDHTVAQIAPSGLFLGSGRGYSGSVYVNCGNPIMTAEENYQLCGLLPGDALQTVGGHTFWNGMGNIQQPNPFGPPGSVFNPGAIPGQSQLLIGRRDIEGGNRQDDLRHTAYRMQIGARGDLGDGWSYDTYGQYGLTLYTEHYLNEFSKTRVQNGLQVDPATGQCFSAEPINGQTPTDPNCVPLDIFNGLGSINSKMLGYVHAIGLKQGWTEEGIVSGSINGDLGAWGGQSPWAKNPIAVAFGGEYRQERIELTTDQEFQTNDLYGQGSATLPIPASGFNVTEGFTEVKIPLIQEKPFAEDLTLNGGYRYSSYNISGATSTYKYGVEWQPIDDVRVRGSINHAVRAPNNIDLFSPFNSVLFSGNDPCAFSTAGQCATVPNAGNPSVLACPATQCNQGIQGNIHLKPESSDTRTVGLVFTPSFLDGFTATVDYWDISVSNFISTLGASNILNGCYAPGATPAQVAFFCPFVHRNGSGQIWVTGSYVYNPDFNTGYLKTSGIDFELNYTSDTANWWGLNEGTVAFNLVGTYLDRLITDPVPTGGATAALSLQSSYNCAGLYGTTACGTPNPKWRHKFRVTWSTPWDFDVSFQWRYIGAVSLDSNTTNPLVGGGPGSKNCGPFTVHGGGDCSDAHIASFDYFDLAGDWTVREGVDLRGGVENIMGTEPPVIGQQALPVGVGNGNTFTGVYDALGRTFFMAATVKY